MILAWRRQLTPEVQAVFLLKTLQQLGD